MPGICETRTCQTVALATILFYVFANPSMFKMVSRIPGLKFVMKTATNEITHSGVMTHALVFGLMMYVIVLLINKTMLRDYVNIVEGLENRKKCGNK